VFASGRYLFASMVLGRVAEKLHKFVGWLILLLRTAKLVAVEASLTAKGMAVMMVTDQTERSVAFVAAKTNGHSDLL
jgi:hypothetical protein